MYVIDKMYKIDYYRYMTIQITAQDARNKFSEMINTAVYGKKNVIITRFDKPQAVLLDYQEYERLMNPKARLSQSEWQEGFAAIDTIRAKAKKVSTQQITRTVDETVLESRKEKRAQSSR
jgi:prevent-host-death family protein